MRPSPRRGSSCRSRKAAPPRPTGSLGLTPQRPCSLGSGKASPSASSASRPATSLGIRRGNHQPPAPHAEFRSEEHTSELQSRENLVCRLLLEKKKRRLKVISD